MRPPPFQFHRPKKLAEAIELIKKGAIPLAGGQALLQELRQRKIQPSTIFALSDLSELSEKITLTGDVVRIGPMVTIAELLEDKTISTYFPWLIEAARKTGDVQVRNLGTVIGNVCWADPRANMAVALLASDAEIVLLDFVGATQKLSLDNFFTGFRETIIENSIATAIEIPTFQDSTGKYFEFSRQPQDLALANVAVVRKESLIKLAIGGIHKTPIYLNTTFDISVKHLMGKIEALDLHPIEDQFGSRDYRCNLVEALLYRAMSVL